MLFILPLTDKITEDLCKGGGGDNDLNNTT